LKYRTIVADPPWEYDEGFAIRGPRTQRGGPRTGELRQRPLPYPSMTVWEIAALPVCSLADRDCRTFLWTTNRYLGLAFMVLEAWGFKYAQTLVWHKTHTNLPASVAPNSAEFILVGAKGKPARLVPWPSAVIADGVGGRTPHSSKPEVFLDLIEQVSPGPYLELFARRQRLGWDTWGNEALEHVQVGVA
jgi:N6-adenosine-specific RNA methylase IME4